MRKHICGVWLALAAVLSAASASAGYRLAAPRPAENLDTYSPVAGGYNAEPRTAQNASGVDVYAFASASIGMTVSEQGGNRNVGDTLLPPDDIDVDWVAFSQTFTNQEAYLKGCVFYTQSTNANERLVISRAGTFQLEWPVKGGDGATVTRSYEVSIAPTVVPHRLFWTSAPYNGPGVTIPDNYGVKVFGDPALMWDSSDTNQYGAASYTYGVHYNTENNMLQAYAETLADGTVHGPRGMIVVAFYDSGSYDRYLGSTVVEVTGPDPVYLNAAVGDELRPQNEHYDPASSLYQPQVQNSSSTDDARAPYVYVQARDSNKYHAKENRVFAISETEEGESGAKKAEVYWLASDDYNVFWPFEQTCYHLAWPSCPTVVIGPDASNRGPGVTIPDEYTSSLLDWRVPRDVVALSNGELTFNGSGRFTLKLANAANDDFWLLPLYVKLSNDAEAFPSVTPVEWPVGYELSPQKIRGSQSSETAAAQIDSLDTDLPGYIYESVSKSRNWNPNLYHFTGAAAGADNPFAALDSAIYFVNVNTLNATDAEVWWQRSYAKSGMTSPLTFPTLPQRYKAVWPADEAAQPIVFASGKGSAAGGLAQEGISLLVADAAARGEVEYRLDSGCSTNMTALLWFDPAPATGAGYGLRRSTGDIIEIEVGENALNLAVVSNETDAAVCTLAFDGKRLATFSCPVDFWSRLVVVTRGLDFDVYANGRFLASSSVSRRVLPEARVCRVTVGARDDSHGAAVNVAVDGLRAWNRAFSAEEVVAYATGDPRLLDAEAALRIDFANVVMTVDGQSFALDENTYRNFRGTGFASVEPGRPRWTDGLLAVSDGVTPRAYVQNDADADGYKPNIEHAIVLAEGEGAYALHAFRNDMNDETCPPYVLAEYARDGRGAMKVCRFLMTSLLYPWPTLESTVAQRVTVFAPYKKLPAGESTETRCASETEADATAVFRDRAKMWWTRRDGTFDQYMYYVGEEGFICNTGEEEERDLAGKDIPAMNLENAYAWPTGATVTVIADEPELASSLPKLASTGATTASAGSSSTKKTSNTMGTVPTPMRQFAKWPDPAGYPHLSVAQTLAKPESGLPEIYNAKSMAVVYPCYGYLDDAPGSTRTEFRDTTSGKLMNASNRVVKLIDPTVCKRVPLAVTSSFAEEYGFTLGSEGNLFSRKGYYYFADMPPNVSDRLYVDVNSTNGTGWVDLCLIGDYQESAAGVSYLRVNSLSNQDRDDIVRTFGKLQEGASDPVAGRLGNLIAAVDSIYDMGDTQPTKQVGFETLEGMTNVVFAKNEYAAADHYALVATGEGSGWVVLVENDSETLAKDLPVSMHLIYVSTNLYCGQIVPLTDANNVLSEQVNVLYTSPLGKSADKFEFEWYACDAPEDGVSPSVPSAPSADPKGGYAGWEKDTDTSGTGAACINAVVDANTGAVTMKKLVNRYWTMHYRATDATVKETTGERWSNWCQPTLSEGWVQRVLNAITPFSQRLTDLYENEAELTYTMPGQIGKPWTGDVALNNENLTEVGLEQLYRTILNRAESLSIAGGEGSTTNDTSPAVNKQLLECVARIADMHMTLGAEAYSDAKNPLIASSDGTEFPGSVFCFANQVPSLLDEELALLRGRTKSVSPALTDGPFYNRLIWNFTKGVTEGEVAYVNNYNISAVDGVLDANAAAAMYPQGHGDAYGYYLSALKGYYRLLRNPNFQWGQASMMEMIIADHVVNMDYQEENKFAECAWNLARIGQEVVDLTARKQWRDNGGDTMSGYFDDPDTALVVSTQANQTIQQSNNQTFPQAFGYGEWACRAGFGALCNWAVANAVLPASTNDVKSYFNDRSISTVTRTTATMLTALADIVRQIDTTVNNVDAGLNPLGLSPNTIPFDISPADFRGQDGLWRTSHYEQIRERAGVALENAETVLAYANVYGSRLRAIENAEVSANESAAEMEASYEKQLVAIYGRPYSGDIGPGKTYEQGYTGPDLYHYMYMDLSEYGLDSVGTLTNALVVYSFDSDAAEDFLGDSVSSDYSTYVDGQLKKIVTEEADTTLTFSLTSDGLVANPVSGTRASEGSLQAAYRSFLCAYVQAQSAQEAYSLAEAEYEWQYATFKTSFATNTALYKTMQDAYTRQKELSTIACGLKMSSTALGFAMDLLNKGFGFTVAHNQDATVGVAYSIPVQSVLRAAVGSVTAASYSISSGVKSSLDMAAIEQENESTLTSLDVQIEQAKNSDYQSRLSQISSLRSALSGLVSARGSLKSAYATLQSAQQSCRTVLEEGVRLQEEREIERTRLVNAATTARYQDMYARVARNAALSKYSTTFDIAQRYVFELAKVYDYETGVDADDADTGTSFAQDVIATRALGQQNISIDGSVTDGGLWDIVNRMDTNFANLKGRLGLNSVDDTKKWFSLRYSNFRISSVSSDESDAAWQTELGKCWTSNILDNALFRRYCQPPRRSDGSASSALPGFVIPFSTEINLAKNFFGKPLQGGETTYPSSDYAVKIVGAGVDFTGYSEAATEEAGGLAASPNVYLVPVGTDYMRAPLSSSRKKIGFTVVDQVLPLPYSVGWQEVAGEDWVATFNGLDGSSDSAATIRRHSTLAMGSELSSMRLAGRSVWNDKWLLVIPAEEMSADVETARWKFLKYVRDIRIGFEAYSYTGN